MNDENPYKSGPAVEAEGGKSKWWIIALVVVVLAGCTCLPVLGVLALFLVRPDTPQPQAPIPIEAPDEFQIQPGERIESIDGELPEEGKEVETGDE